MKRTIAIIFAMVLGAVFLIASVVVAQQQGPVPGQPGVPPPGQPVSPTPGQNFPHRPPQPADPLGHVMFPPDLIMGHARQLGLTDDQKAYMRAEIQKTTSSFHDLQWKLQDQMEVLHDIMKSTSVNEDQALAQLNKVLDIEREIKRLHIGLAVRIKNRLTPEQQEKLHIMRMGQHFRPDPPTPEQ